MKHVRARLTASGAEQGVHPVYDVLVTAPYIDRARALQWNFSGAELGILHHITGDADAFEQQLLDTPEVLGYEIERTGDDEFYVYTRDETTKPLRDLFGRVAKGGIIIVPPIVYRTDGAVMLSLFGPDAAVQSAVEDVPGPVGLQVDAVTGLQSTGVTAETRLSTRQREALVAALELGYYEVPREASHEAVAEAIDCAPSTAAEHLRKAESNLIHAVIDT
jgi:hypothetical protein